MCSSTDGAACGAKDPEDPAHDHQNHADGPQDGNLREEPHDQKHESEDDHLNLHSLECGRPSLLLGVETPASYPHLPLSITPLLTFQAEGLLVSTRCWNQPGSNKPSQDRMMRIGGTRRTDVVYHASRVDQVEPLRSDETLG